MFVAYAFDMDWTKIEEIINETLLNVIFSDVLLSLVSF